MTIPWLMNCPHTDDGWCLDCVGDLGKKWSDLAFPASKTLTQNEQALIAAINAQLEEIERVKADRDRLRDAIGVYRMHRTIRDACLRAEGREEMLRLIAAEELKDPKLPTWQVRDRLESLLERGQRASNLVFRLRGKVSKLSAAIANCREALR